MVLRTKNDRYYLTESEVVAFSKRLKAKVNFAPSLAVDIANLIEGGEMLSESEVKTQLRKQIAPTVQIRPNASGQYSTVKGAKVGTHGEAFESYIDEAFEFQRNAMEFLRQIIPDLPKLPGRTPLEKTFALLRILDKQNKSKSSSSPSPSGGGESQEFQATFGGGNAAGVSAATNVGEALEFNDKITTEGKELLSTLDDGFYNDTDDGDSDMGNAFILADETYKQILRSASMLDKVTSIHTKPSRRLIADVTGDRVEFRSIRGMHEFGKIQKSELILPKAAMLSRVMQSQSQVKQVYRQEQSMPIVALLIDDSGSMNENHKREKALGILHNMLERVMRGDTWLLFSFFEEEAHGFFLFEAGDREAVKKFYRDATKHRFNTGGTEVGNAAQQILQRLDKVYEENTSIDFSVRDKHLILVNDGQDDATKLTLRSLGGAKLHSFILDSNNEYLRQLSLQSGGSYRSKL